MSGAGRIARTALFTAMLAAFGAPQLAVAQSERELALEARVAAALWRYTVAQGLVAWAVIHLFPGMI